MFMPIGEVRAADGIPRPAPTGRAARRHRRRARRKGSAGSRGDLRRRVPQRARRGGADLAAVRIPGDVLRAHAVDRSGERLGHVQADRSPAPDPFCRRVGRARSRRGQGRESWSRAHPARRGRRTRRGGRRRGVAGDPRRGARPGAAGSSRIRTGASRAPRGEAVEAAGSSARFRSGSETKEGSVASGSRFAPPTTWRSTHSRRQVATSQCASRVWVTARSTSSGPSFMPTREGRDEAASRRREQTARMTVAMFVHVLDDRAVSRVVGVLGHEIECARCRRRRRVRIEHRSGPSPAPPGASARRPRPRCATQNVPGRSRARPLAATRPSTRVVRPRRRSGACGGDGADARRASRPPSSSSSTPTVERFAVRAARVRRRCNSSIPRAALVTGVAPAVVEDLEELVPELRGRTAVLPSAGPDPSALPDRLAAPVEHPWFAGDTQPLRASCVWPTSSPARARTTLVRALPAIRAAIGDARLLLIGRIDEEDFAAELRRLAADLHVADARLPARLSRGPTPAGRAAANSARWRRKPRDSRCRCSRR